MAQSSLKPGLLFQPCSSAQVTRLPVRWRTVSSAERQYVPLTSTSTPSTSKIRICGCVGSDLRRRCARFGSAKDFFGTDPRRAKTLQYLKRKVSPLHAVRVKLRPARLLGQEAACYNRSVRIVGERDAPLERGPQQIISLRTYREWPGIDGAVPSWGCWPRPGRQNQGEKYGGIRWSGLHRF